MTSRWALVLLCLTAPTPAQEPQTSPEMNVDSVTLDRWLQSGDPRLIAWAADFARRRHDERILSEVPRLLEHWSVPPMVGGNEEQEAQRRAELALLDSVIQENVQIPLSVIETTAENFPAQALLLIQRVPMENSRTILMKWAFPGDGTIKGARSRAAAMILAKSPDSSFVRRVLDGLVQHVTVHIVSPGTGGGGGINSCGDSLGSPPTPGWPLVYTYRLVDSDTGTGTNLISIVNIGTHNIWAGRFEENSGWGECSNWKSDAAFRHELVAYWLGIEPKEMLWQPYQSLNVVWTTKPAYEREVGAYLEEDRAKMSDTLRQLLNRQFLDEKTPEGTFPQISIRIECDVSPCPLPGVWGSRR